jgi:alkaline phosphatase D
MKGTNGLRREMDRREFLRWGSFLTVSVASGTALTACGGDDGSDGSSAPPPADGGTGGTNPPPGGGQQPSYSYDLGVASGDPKADSIVLWTHVAGGDGMASIPLTVQVASDAAFTQILLDTPIQADPSWNYTVRHKVTGLGAATVYYYRFIAGVAPATVTSIVGRTKTAPAAAANPAQLKFAVISCQDWSNNHWAAFSELVNEDLDFVVHVGDYIYEALPAQFLRNAAEQAHPALILPNGTTLPDGSVYATTLADYRYLYQSYRSDPRLQALHAKFPMIAIWDDHEFSDDCWQDRQTYEPGDDATPRTARRRSANQAWFEFMPSDVTLNLADPSFENIQIYRSFNFGSLATLVMTDERLYRADHVIPETATGGEIGSRFLVPKAAFTALQNQKIAAAAGALTPVSMLGDTQRGWWQEQMTGATTTWKLWGNEVSLLRMQVDIIQATAAALSAALVAAEAALAAIQAQMTAALVSDIGGADRSGPKPITTYPALAALLVPAFGQATFDGVVRPELDARLPPSQFLDTFLLDADQWDGYDAERRALMSFLATNGVQNVVALTGDIHSFFAGAVMDDFDAQTPKPVMVDLVTTSVSSPSLFDYYVNVVHTNAALAPLAALVYSGATNVLDGTLSQFNPWLKYVDTNAHGYSVITLTASDLTCEFKKMKPLVDGMVPAAPATASVVTVRVQVGTAAVSVVQ